MEIFIALVDLMDQPDQNIASSWTWHQKLGQELQICILVSSFLEAQEDFENLFFLFIINAFCLILCCFFN